tara:strand:- start:42938 stop:43297 length:360 start_codon:yes stop_codon:yes gene_type:complete
MNKSHYDKLSKVFINEVTKTRDAGQKEYAHDKDNVFANFERVAESLDISREKALMTYLLKHIDGIKAYVKGHTSQRESVKGRITDAIVYLLLLWAMVEENEYVLQHKQRDRGNSGKLKK